MTIVRKGFVTRLQPSVILRIDEIKGRLSRNKWLEALIERELDTLERERDDKARSHTNPADDPQNDTALRAADISEVGEPAGLELLAPEPQADPVEESSEPSDPEAYGDEPTSDDAEDWWKE